MMRKLFSFSMTIISTTLFIFSLGIFNCDTTQPTGPNTIPPPEGIFTVSNYNFNNSDSTISLLTSICKIVKDTLIKDLSTTVYKYTLSNDTLRIVYTPKDNVKYSIFMFFSRLSGESLEGEWLFQSSWYEINGICSKTDSLRVLLTFDAYSKKEFRWIKIEKNIFTIYSDTGAEEFTRRYHLTYQTQSFDEKYNIVFDSISPQSHRLFGNNTYDTVTIQFVPIDTTLIFTSNDTISFPDHIFNSEISICTELMYPDWFEKFLQQNSRTLNINFSSSFLAKLRNDTTLNKYYDITYDSISPYSLRIIGHVSNDTIIITKTFEMDVIYTSNNPLYSTYITNDYSPNPKGIYPPWLQTTPDNFKSKNRKEEAQEIDTTDN